MSNASIADYGIIGDLHTVALVGKNGSIDFLSFPEFDSPTVFAALLDDQRGGRFQIAPEFDDVHPKQIYLPDTNILITRHLSEHGVSEIIDFMPVEEVAHAHNLVRIVKTVRGEVRYAWSDLLRFGGFPEPLLRGEEQAARRWSRSRGCRTCSAGAT